MTAKHTPGPWLAEPQEDGCSVSYIIAAEVGEAVASTYSAEGPKEEEANARLIAAAPDMLEALKVAGAALRAHGLKDSWDAGQVAAAIAKAEYRS